MEKKRRRGGIKEEIKRGSKGTGDERQGRKDTHRRKWEKMIRGMMEDTRKGKQKGGVGTRQERRNKGKKRGETQETRE